MADLTITQRPYMMARLNWLEAELLAFVMIIWTIYSETIITYMTKTNVLWNNFTMGNVYYNVFISRNFSLIE